MKGLVIFRTAAADKSVDGQGGIQRGNFYVNNVLVENATLVNGIVYNENGELVGPVDP